MQGDDNQESGTISEQVLPDWLNPLTTRGLIFALTGLVLLLIPEYSGRLLVIVAGTALALTGAAILWAAIRRRPRRIVDIVVGIAGMIGGVALLVLPEASLRVAGAITAFYLAATGVSILVRSWRRRRDGDLVTFHLVRGALYIAGAVIVAALAHTVVTGVIFMIAFGAFSLGVFMMAVGISDEEAADLGSGELGEFAIDWLKERDLGDSMRDSVVDSLYFEDPDSVQKQVGFWVLLILSTTIATLGVMADSTAVVIGAMLVAPLMTPIMGVSAGVVNGWLGRVSTSFATVAGGVAVSIGTAVIVAAWTPQLIPLASNSQVLSRVSPTLIDMLIAIAAGAAGAYATIDKRVSSSITGVAIAVALVPPLAVVGITLESGAFDDAIGAFLLFATNLVSIILVASIVFVVGGLAPLDQMQRNAKKTRTVVGTVVLGAMVIIIPLAFTSEGIINSASRQATASKVVEEWLGEDSTIRVNRVEVASDEVSATLSGEGDIPPIDDLDDAMEDAFGADVTVTVDYFPSVRLESD